MADTRPKRPREPQQEEQLFSCDVEITKRHKNSFNQILSILEDNTDDELPEPTQDLNAFLTALQQELSSDPSSELSVESIDTVKKEETEDIDDKEMVIRHLLEASDDELGLPNRLSAGYNDDDEVPAGNDGGIPVAFCDGLWDLEDDADNYCSLLHSEL